MKRAKLNCENGNCFEYNKMGGDARYHELDNINKQERKKDELRRKTQKDTHPENMYNDGESASEKGINSSNLSSDSEHRTTVNKQIMSNNEALREEISEIRYLIEYINNNKKTKL
jgi:lipopolysaccharide export LptBFGC system permease protein LptF